MALQADNDHRGTLYSKSQSPVGTTLSFHCNFGFHEGHEPWRWPRKNTARILVSGGSKWYTSSLVRESHIIALGDIVFSYLSVTHILSLSCHKNSFVSFSRVTPT